MSLRSELCASGGEPRPGNVLLRRRLEHNDGRQVLVYGCGSDALDLPASRGLDRRTGEIHRRLDLLTDEWVVISPERNVRPNDPESTAPTDVACPICSSFRSPTTQPSSRIGSRRSPRANPRPRGRGEGAERHGHAPSCSGRKAVLAVGAAGLAAGTGGVELSRELNTPASQSVRAAGLDAGRHRRVR